MNSKKLAVFVEGQTELVFVREFLKQWYGYDVNIVGFDCYNLLSKEFCDAEYKYGNEDSENYFMIVNVGNDNSVLSSIGTFVDFHFAIMEIEAWFLGMDGFMDRLDSRLTRDFVIKNLNINLDDDPENTIFHPAAELGKIYALVDKQYDKHKSDISSIMSLLTNDDFLRLINSGKCNTFKMFAESLLGVRF